MLPRRFSKHLADQNWTAFAIDFVIVIVGVFIAVQAANWNEDRVLDNRETTYLEQLLIDLEADARTGERGVAEADEIDTAASRLLATIEGDQTSGEISDAQLMTYVAQAGYAYIPQAQSTTYEEMISTGALSRIEDLDLKRALSSYYERAETGQQWNVLLREEQYAYRAAIRGVLTREQFAWARAHVRDAEDIRFDPPPLDRAALVAELRSRPEVLNSLRSMGAVQQRLRDNSHSMTRAAERVADQVSDAIER